MNRHGATHTTAKVTGTGLILRNVGRQLVTVVAVAALGKDLPSLIGITAETLQVPIAQPTLSTNGGLPDLDTGSANKHVLRWIMPTIRALT